MKYRTFLDYATLEVTGKNIEAKLSERERGTNATSKRFYELGSYCEYVRSTFDYICKIAGIRKE